MIDAGRSWLATARHTGLSTTTTTTVRCHSSYPAPESRVVYTNSGMDLAAAIACRRHSRSEYAMTTEIRAMTRSCWPSRMPRTRCPCRCQHCVAGARRARDRRV
jgi:hypothetical protein